MDINRLLSFRLRVGRVAGIDVHLHWTLLIAAIYILYQWYGVAGSLREGMLVLLVLFGSVFLHELGHCWGARRVGGEAREVLLWPLGGLAYLDVPRAPWPEFFSTVMGPAVNVVLAALALAVLLPLGGGWAWGGFYAEPVAPFQAGLGLWCLARVVEVNVILALFNVIPAFPMDGGRLLQCALWPRMGFHRAMQVTIVVALVCGGLMVLYGLFRGGFVLAIGALVIVSALQERERLRYGLLEESLSPWAASLSSGYREEAEPRPGPIARWIERRRLRREEETTRRRAEMRQRLDEVLAKVSAQGLGGLSREERRFLEQASQELRREQQARSG